MFDVNGEVQKRFVAGRYLCNKYKVCPKASVVCKQLTVSQVKQRVSLVKTPSNKLCTSVASFRGVPEFEFFEFVEVVMMVGVVFEASVATEPDTLYNIRE